MTGAERLLSTTEAYPLSRRRFLAASALTALACDRPVFAAAGRRPKYKYIDIHTHLGAFHAGQNVSVSGLLAWMDGHDVERAVLLPLVSPEAAPRLHAMQTSDAAIEAAAAHPDRLIAFCCLDPRVTTTNPARFGHVDGVRGLTEALRRYKDAGARGFGEHKVGLPFDHPQMMQIYEACDSLELPILFHLDDLRGIDTPGLPRLENVLKAFPKLPLIGHACGFWSSISGDATPEDFGRYPTPPKAITPGGALDRLLDAYANLYCDISEPGGTIALTRDPAFAREFVLRRADRLLFGSDYLMPGQQVPQFDILAAMELPDEVAYKIHRGNAIRILKLAAT
jgi:predicted TIM-barrel fold metal-dependent hydrolase